MVNLYVLLGRAAVEKPLFLNTVVGLLKPSKGEILLDQQKIDGPGKDRAMVFQTRAFYRGEQYWKMFSMELNC